jgi:hypothetical protein
MRHYKSKCDNTFILKKKRIVMAEVSLTIVKIRQGVMRLLEKAKKDILDLPDKTHCLKFNFISVPFEDKGKKYSFKFRCTPPFEELGDGKNKMWICCMVENPSKKVETLIPTAYAPVKEILESFNNHEYISRLTLLFEALLIDSEKDSVMGPRPIYEEFATKGQLVIVNE